MKPILLTKDEEASLKCLAGKLLTFKYAAFDDGTLERIKLECDKHIYHVRESGILNTFDTVELTVDANKNIHVQPCKG